MPSYKLTYLDGQGLAEPVRIMFAVAGQKFEDVRIKSEDWPKVKPTMPYGHVPVLEVDGKILPESIAIRGYVARELKLYGANSWESALIDVVCGVVMDTLKLFGGWMFEKDESRKSMLKKEYDEFLPVGLGNLEKTLKQNNGGDGFFVGDKLSMADIQVFVVLGWIVKVGDGGPVLDKLPKLKALQARVAANKNIAAYLAQRKPTEF